MKNIFFLFLILFFSGIYAYQITPIEPNASDTISNSSYKIEPIIVTIGGTQSNSSYKIDLGYGAKYQDRNATLTITSPANNSKFYTTTGTQNIVMSYSYSPDSSFVKIYWVKNDNNSWISNSKNTSYTFNLSAGTHVLYVKAQQQDDFNIEATPINIEIIGNVPSGQTGAPGDGSIPSPENMPSDYAKSNLEFYSVYLDKLIYPYNNTGALFILKVKNDLDKPIDLNKLIVEFQDNNKTVLIKANTDILHPYLGEYWIILDNVNLEIDTLKIVAEVSGIQKIFYEKADIKKPSSFEVISYVVDNINNNYVAKIKIKNKVQINNVIQIRYGLSKKIDYGDINYLKNNEFGPLEEKEILIPLNVTNENFFLFLVSSEGSNSQLFSIPIKRETNLIKDFIENSKELKEIEKLLNYTLVPLYLNNQIFNITLGLALLMIIFLIIFRKKLNIPKNLVKTPKDVKIDMK